MDPKHWDTPTWFNPERHIKDGKIKKNPAYMPFSVGTLLLYLLNMNYNNDYTYLNGKTSLTYS